MIKLIKIASKLFPERYKLYTNFHATYGYIGLYEDDNVVLFLDPRYYTSAKDACIAFKPLKEMPRESCVLDPFEWTIAEFDRYKFINPIFECHEEYSLAQGMALGHIATISDFLEAHPGKQYLLTNINTIKEPTHALVMTENGDIVPLTDVSNAPFNATSNAVSNILFDPDITPIAYTFAHKFDIHNAIVDPIRALDPIMNDIDGYEKFLLNDAVAWMNFWQKLEGVYSGITELDAAMVLESDRKKMHGKNFKPAFETIAGCNENAAKIHTTASNKMLEDGVLLVDAGSKLDEYTSDITRIFLLGCAKNISYELKKAYTNTLKAHIAVVTEIFAKDMHASYLDQIARKYVHFDHALGHGVGKEDVHAYPAIRLDSNMPLKENMIIAIEPGFYVPGEFGIRLESMLQVIEHDEQNYALKYLVFIPFEYDLIIYDQLEESERAWLSKFHQICYDKLKEHVDVSFLNAKTSKFIEYVKRD